MISRTVLSLLVLAIAAPALAQPIAEIPAPRGRDDDRGPPPKEQVFISPAGEPFRAPLGAPYPIAAWFARADADRDGSLAAHEFAADHMAFFVSLDADKDGVIDGFESNTYEKTIAPEVAGELRIRPRRERAPLFGRRAPAGAELQGAAVFGLINEPLPVRAADANLDFKVTREETQAAAERRFGLLDLDKDGRLTLAELPATRAQAQLNRRR